MALTTEQVQDIVGAMVSSNTESAITVTYQDSDGTLDFAHNDTSSVSSADLSGGFVIQDLTIDTYGHVTGIGSVGLDDRFLQLSGGTLTGNIVMSGSETVDGRDLSVDGAKLDGIEASATADQTASEIRTLVESASDSNVFTDADHSKLNAIEASADVTDTTNVVAALTAGTNITIAGDGTISSTDTNTQLSTEQVQDIVGAMVSSNTESAITVTYQDSDGTLDFAHNDTSSVSSADLSGGFVIQDLTIDTYGHVTGIGSVDLDARFLELSGGTLTGNIVMSGSETVDGRDLSVDGAKLDNIEANADVTDSTNVVAALTAGSNITIAGDGTISSTDTNTQLSSEQVQDIVGAMVASNTESGITVTYEDSDGTLDFAVASQTDENFTTADHAKLDGIEASADVTDTTNVVAALTAGTNITIAGDGTISSTDTNTQLSSEQVQDIVGAMVSSNTESGITVTYEDSDGTLDFAVASQTDNNFTNADHSKLDGIEAGADVTPSWVPDADPSYATQSYVGTQISNLVDSAPAALDTLNELAAALGDDANFSTTVTNSIATKLPLAGGTMTGNIVMSGSETVDGRDLSVDGAKLDNIEASADVTDTANVVAALTAGSNITIAGDGTISSTDTNTQLSTEQVQDIVGAMVSSNTESAITVTYQDSDGTLDFAHNDTSGASSADLSDGFVIQDLTIDTYGHVTGIGSVNLDSRFLQLSGGTLTGNIVMSGSETVDGRDVSADGTKLDGIEASADVTDTTNVVAALTAGSNITIAGDGTISSTDTNTQLSTEQVQDIIGAMVSSNTESGITVTYEDSDGTLDFAVASQTDQNFTNADHSKLDGIEASADVTDTANVVAALTAGSNITIAGDGTISSTDTNTSALYRTGPRHCWSYGGE